MTILAGAPPTEAGFLDFVRNAMGITSTALPDASPVIPAAFGVAIEIVNATLCQVSPLIYELAVYNLAGSNLLRWAPDVAGSAYFKDTRTLWNINSFAAGVVQAAADVSTSASLVVPDSLKALTLANLQQLKDPYGRQYLSFAQDYGPDAWGVT